MANVDLVIGGNAYTVACRDGEEDRLRAIAAMVDQKAQDARKAVGGVSEARQLLFASLLLADELDETRRKASLGEPLTPPAVQPDGSEDVALLDDIAARLESLALRLEQRG